MVFSAVADSVVAGFAVGLPMYCRLFRDLVVRDSR